MPAKRPDIEATDPEVERGSFGPVLRRLRLEAQISQEELAERAHLSVESISALERGRRRAPYRDTVRMLADALRLSENQRQELAATVTRGRLEAGLLSATEHAPNLQSLTSSLSRFDNNLPLQLSSFVGRESELAEIASLVRTHRLVTLTGSGGVGKTRTSLQVAANLLDGAGDGVWFIELAPLASGEYIATTVAQALGLTLASDGEPIDNLVRALKGKHALLLFDNCEHLVEPTARVLSALLNGCPKVNILASSREGLGIAGEMTYRLPSLGVPSDADVAQFSANDVALYAATALFVERARAADFCFALTGENAPAIAEICRRLDGIPLAIELAAARVKILSPRQLRERLDERFRLLTGGSRDVLPRQQTLRALIDWSHDLLDEHERTLFRRLGIFVNGFTLEGAVAVGSAEGFDEFDAFDALASLVDKSLVLAEPDGDALRYRLLESTRIYAREKLENAGEREGCATRHLRYLRDRCVEAQERYERTARLPELEATFATELEDVRGALDWALGGSDAPVGGEILAAISPGWRPPRLGEEWLARLEAFTPVLSGGDSRLLARHWTAVTCLAANSWRTARAFEAATEAVAQARLCGHSATLANALREYAESAAHSRRFEGGEAALAEAESIQDISPALRLRLLQTRAFLSSLRGDLEAASRTYEQLRKEHRALGNALSEQRMAVNLAEVEHARGQTPRAITIAREVLPEARAHRDRSMHGRVLANLAGYLATVDDLPEACALAREAIRAFAPLDPQGTDVAVALEHLALTLALGGDIPRAAKLAGYAHAAMRKHASVREFTERTTYNRLTALLCKALAPDQREHLLAEGAALAPEAAITLAVEEP